MACLEEYGKAAALKEEDEEGREKVGDWCSFGVMQAGVLIDIGRSSRHMQRYDV